MLHLTFWRDIDHNCNYLKSSKDRNSRGGSVSETSENVEVRLLFHHTQVGCIIGKGGAKIKELREVFDPFYFSLFVAYSY